MNKYKGKEIIIKYKVKYMIEDVITKQLKENELIFDTLNEANEWLRLTGINTKPIEIKGILVDEQQVCGIGLGIYARNIKVFKEIKENE